MDILTGTLPRIKTADGYITLLMSRPPVRSVTVKRAAIPFYSLLLPSRLALWLEVIDSVCSTLFLRAWSIKACWAHAHALLYVIRVVLPMVPGACFSASCSSTNKVSRIVFGGKSLDCYGFSSCRITKLLRQLRVESCPIVF